MWDNYPEPIILIYKDRTIMATNKISEKAGLQIGIKKTLINFPISALRAFSTKI
jgi:hypothetical protein